MTGLRERIEAERAALLDAARGVEIAAKSVEMDPYDPWVVGYHACAEDNAGFLRDRAGAS